MNHTEQAHSVDDYQILVRKLSAEQGGGFFAHAVDIPGCGAQAETAEEALSECRSIVEMALESFSEDNVQPPDAADYSPGRFSGRFIVRVPRSLHQRLVLKARSENTSLNQLCVHYLSESLARREEAEKPHRVHRFAWQESAGGRLGEAGFLSALLNKTTHVPYDDPMHAAPREGVMAALRSRGVVK